MIAKLYDRVKQPCDTTFTGTSLPVVIDHSNTALNGFNTFNTVVALGTDVYYVVESTDPSKDEWECGRGTFNQQTISFNTYFTIQRSKIFRSSAGTSKVNFTSGPKIAYIAPLATVLSNLAKNSFSEGVVPNNTFDYSQGYERGSIVGGSASDFYICVDPTNGAAVWAPLTTDIAVESSRAILKGRRYFDMTLGITPVSDTGIAYNDTDEIGNTFTGAWSLSTADATPTQFASQFNIGNFADYVAAVFEGTVVANSGADSKMWKIISGVEFVLGDTPSCTFGTPTVTVLKATGGASAWGIDFVDCGDHANMTLEATGAAATDINWYVTFTVSQGGSP